MSKPTLPFTAPKTEFEFEEFVVPSEVEGVLPRRFRDRDRDEQLERFREDAPKVRAAWDKARKKKLKELGRKVDD